MDTTQASILSPNLFLNMSGGLINGNSNLSPRGIRETLQILSEKIQQNEKTRKRNYFGTNKLLRYNSTSVARH